MKQKTTLQQIDQTNPVTRGSTALVYKQETLEEAANKYFNLAHSRLVNNQQKEYEKELFFAGAKWQQEKSYTEEEVLELMYRAFKTGYTKYEVVEAGLEGLETEIECNWILKKYNKI
jgi:hypothetical protein